MVRHRCVIYTYAPVYLSRDLQRVLILTKIPKARIFDGHQRRIIVQRSRLTTAGDRAAPRL